MQTSAYPSDSIITPESPIGMLDSGLGGLSVMRAVRALMPAEDILYCADCGNAPWGDRPTNFIIERCEAICRFMTERNCKAIVLACNTATAIAAEALRSHITIPVIGIEPAVKPAATASHTHRVGVIATTRTITSERYRSLLARFATGSEVISMAAPGLMECVERGDFDTAETRDLLASYIAPMMEKEIDTLVLGCTHYPFLTDAINEITGGTVRVIEPGPAVAQVTRTRLIETGVLRDDGHTGTESFFVKNAATHAGVLTRLWPGVSALTPSELTA